MQAIFGERVARNFSPPLLILVALCFLLPFAAASCNTDRAKSDPRITRQPPAARALFDRCLDNAKGQELFSYSGYDLVTGGDPTVSNDRINGCPQQTTGAAAQATAKTVNIGSQGWFIGVLIVLLAGIVASALRFPGRGFLVTALCGAGIALLLVGLLQIQGAVSNKLSPTVQALLGSARGNLPSDSFIITAGLGLWLAVALLAVTAVFNLVTDIVILSTPPGGSRASPWR